LSIAELRPGQPALVLLRQERRVSDRPALLHQVPGLLVLQAQRLAPARYLPRPHDRWPRGSA
jgi:hypothetical protein